MDEFLSDLADHWSEDVGRSEVVNRLSKRYEDEGNLELVVGKVSEVFSMVYVGSGNIAETHLIM